MIEIRELSFKYKGGANYSLKDINLIVKKGECILLCGRSGCGKSTLLKLMNGIIPEFYDGDISGSVMVNGMNTFTTPIYKLSKNVGSVFQNPKTQFYTTNTTDEIAFGLENYGIEREVINKRIEEVEKELHLENLMNKNIFNLSGGEKQKIAIASIYALNPEIFILDEPSSSLDIKSMKELSLTIKKLKSLGKTIIIAEHRLWYLKDIADRAIYLEDGKIIREYSMDEIENLSEDERTRTGLRHSDYKAIERFDDFETSNKGTLLELKNLIFKRNTKIILSIEDLKFCYGNIIGIVGENGIGKSTLAKIICGLYKENKGKILKDDENLQLKSRLNESLLIMQEVNYQLFTDSVKDEIVLTSKGVEIIEGHLMPDHVHMLVSIPPRMSVASFMGYLKGKSALMIFDKHANLKYKFGNRHFWAEGYYVSTVGLNEATIKKYIQEQEKHDIALDKLSVKEYENPFRDNGK